MAKVFSDGAASQYQEIARKVLSQKPGDLGRPFDPGPRGQNLQFLRVTGAGTVQSGRTYYPSVLTLKDIAGGTWSDAPSGATIWLEDRNGVDLVTDGTAVYLAKQITDAFAVSGTTHSLFETFAQECTNSTGDFPNIDETTADDAFQFLGTDPVLGTRNILNSDMGKVIQKAEGVHTIASSATPTLDAHNGRRQRMVMTSNATFSITGDWDGFSGTLELVQDGTGGWVPTFSFGSPGVTWHGQIAPRPTLTPNARDLYHFEQIASGNYRGCAMLNR